MAENFIYYKGHEWVNEDDATTNSPTISADNLNEMEDGIANALPMSGGKMQGQLILNGSPEELLEAVTKQYADTNIMYIYEVYSQTGTYTKKIEGFDADKYLPLVFLWRSAYNVSKHFTIAKYDEKKTYYASGDNSSYITIGSDGNITIEVNHTNEYYPLIVLFLPAKKI